MGVIDDVVATIESSKRWSLGWRTPFAICLESRARDRLCAEMRQCMRYWAGSTANVPVYETRVCGALIGTVTYGRS